MLVGIGRCVIDERERLLRSWQQPGEVERDAPDKRAPIGFRSKMQARFFELHNYEVINWRLHPGSVLGLWQGNRWARRRFESPMRPVHGALTDPLLQRGNLCRAHRLRIALGRLRHQIMRIPGCDPLDQFTLFRMPWNNRGRTTLPLLQSPFRLVKAEARLS